MFDLLSSVINPIVGKFVNLIPDTNARAKAQEELEKELLIAIMQSSKDQAEINKIEASNSNLFIAGARPFILWICAFALCWEYLLLPISSYFIAFFMTIPPLPTLNSEGLFNLMIGMLGLSTLRTYEKRNDVQGNH